MGCFACCCSRCKKTTEPVLPLINEAPVDTMNIPEVQNQSPSEKEQYPLNIVLPKYINPNIENDNLFKPEHYRQDEKESHAYFSKRSIFAWLHSEFDSERDALYTEFHNADNMVLSENKEGSFLTKEIPLTRMVYKMAKADFPENTTVEMIASYTHGSTNRRKWDKGMKEYKITEGDDFNGILYSWMNSPIKLISERDLIDKKADFIMDGDFYSFASSTENDVYQEVENVTRILDYCSLAYITVEEEWFVFKTLSQIDIKSNFAAMTKNLLPRKLKTWYNDMKEQIKKDHEGETKE